MQRVHIIEDRYTAEDYIAEKIISSSPMAHGTCLNKRDLEERIEIESLK